MTLADILKETPQAPPSGTRPLVLVAAPTQRIFEDWCRAKGIRRDGARRLWREEHLRGIWGCQVFLVERSDGRHELRFLRCLDHRVACGAITVIYA